MLLDAQAGAPVYTTPPPSETPYALAKLGESARIIRQSISELPNLRRRLDKNMDSKAKARDIHGDLQNQHRRLMGALNTAALSLLEAEQDELANHSAKLGQSIKSFNLMTPDYSKLCAMLSDYLVALPVVDSADETQTTNVRIIGRLMNNVRMGYYPTCLDNLAHITRGIDFPQDITANLLDPCCGCGLALRSVADIAKDNGHNCITYGIELDEYRAEEASTRIDRVGFGSYFYSRTSNDAFHAMLLNTPYLSVMTEGGNNTRNEKKFLVDSYQSLMIGGLLIYIIPYYRLTADIAKILCDNFSDISVWRFTDSEFKKFKQIAVMGVRQKKIDDTGFSLKLTAMMLEPGMLPEITELPAGRYRLPDTVKEVALFKGALFNEKELAEQLSKSKGFTRLFQRSQLDNADKRPLLPLSIGQIGLVGGSGMINGWVDCDTPHIIKGRIVKEKRARVDENTNSKGQLTSTTLTETVSNKLIFNLLTPKGFISLTDHGGGSIDEDFGDDRHGDNPHNGNPRAETLSANAVAAHEPDYARRPLFPLGQTVITRGANETIAEYDVMLAISRHQSGDWGEVSDADWKSNDRAIKKDERILSSYISSNDEKFWIITEWDRSATTVLLPDEY